MGKAKVSLSAMRYGDEYDSLDTAMGLCDCV